MEKPYFAVLRLSFGLLRRATILRHDFLMVCDHPKPWRRMVEVAGVEPASYGRSDEASTCLATYLISHPNREAAR